MPLNPNLLAKDLALRLKANARKMPKNGKIDPTDGIAKAIAQSVCLHIQQFLNAQGTSNVTGTGIGTGGGVPGPVQTFVTASGPVTIPPGGFK